MNKFLKYGIGTLAGAGVLTVGTVAYVAATFDPNSYKAQVIQIVQDSKQRTLKLDGDIKLNFFPSLGLSVSGVSLSEYKSPKEFAALDQANLSVKLIPLLSRRLVVDTVSLSGVHADIVKHKDGSTNLDDLLGASQPETAPAAPAQGVPMQFDVAAIRIDQAALNYRDEGTGATYSVHDLNLTTGRVASGVPVDVELGLKISANQPKLDLTTGLKARVTFDLAQGNYEIEKLELDGSGSALDLSGIKLQATGGARAKQAQDEYVLDHFVLEASANKAADHFALKLSVPALAYQQGKITGDSVAVNANVNGETGDIAAVLQMPTLESTATTFKIGALGLDVDVKQPEQTFKLQLSTPLSGSLETRQFNVADLRIALEANGEKLPGKRIKSEMKGSVQADLIRESVQGNLAGGILQSQVKAKFALNNFKAPAIRYDLELDQFDADPYMPPKAKTEEAPQQASGPEQPFDLSSLRDLNLEGSVRIGALKAANVKVQHLRVDVKAKDGQIDIAPLSAKLYQGSMDGKLAINARKSTFSIDERFKGVDIAPLLADAAKLEVAEGRGDISLNVTTQGNKVSALKKSLNGSAAVNLENGSVKGIDLNKLVRGIQSLSKDTRMQTLGVDKAEKTSFSELKATLKIKNGVAHNDDLSVKSTVLRIAGSGDIDIGNDRMDYNAKVIMAKTEQGRTGTLPVDVNGPFDALKIKVDYAALLGDLARQKLDEKKEEVKSRLKEDAKSKVQEELKKGLKGLFR